VIKNYCSVLFCLFIFPLFRFNFWLVLKFLILVLGSWTQSVGLTEVLQWQYVAMQWSGFESQLPTFKIMFTSLALKMLVCYPPQQLEGTMASQITGGWVRFKAEGINALKNSNFVVNSGWAISEMFTSRLPGATNDCS
jgi:hypothetical protein